MQTFLDVFWRISRRRKGNSGAQGALGMSSKDVYGDVV
jgi:hypothetical protein